MGSGQNVRRMREARGLTLEALAKRAGVSLHTIMRWELGHVSHPRSHSLHAIAEALGVSVEELLSGPVSPPPSTAVPGSLSQDEREVVEAMRKLGPAQRAKIWGFAVGIVASQGSVEAARAAGDLAEAGQQAQEEGEDG